MFQQHRARFALAGIPASAALILAGCAADTSEPDATQGGSFTFSYPTASDVDDFYSLLAEQYMEETGVDIELLPIPQTAYETQLPTQLQSGNAADLFRLTPGGSDPVSVVRLAEAGLLAPLGSGTQELIPAGTEGQYEVDGEVYGHPTSQVPVGIVWNTVASADSGIAYPGTFEETVEACRTANENGLDYMVLAGTITNNLGLFAQGLSATRVYAEEPDWNDQRAAGDVTFSDSEWRTVLEDIIEMNEAQCFQDGPTGSGFDAIDRIVLAGDGLSAALPANAATSMNRTRGVSMEARPYAPRDGGAEWILLSARDAFGISAQADESAQDAAREFLAWLGEPENAATLAELEGSFSVTGALPEELAPPLEPVAGLVSSGAYSPLPTDTWPNPAVYAELGSGIQGLLTGQRTVDDVLNAMDAAWDS